MTLGLVTQPSGAHEQNRLRRAKRFCLKDLRVWGLKASGKALPALWIHNLSGRGIQMRYPRYNCYDVGDRLKIQVTFMGEELFQITGVVRWRMLSLSHVNMYILGIEFTEEESPVGLESPQLAPFLSYDSASHQKPSKTLLPGPYQSAQRAVTDLIIISAGVVPFVLGYIYSFI